MTWLQSSPNIREYSDNRLDALRDQYKLISPETIAQIKNLNNQFTPQRKTKGYNLAKVKNKKLGFVYYARYIVDGKLIPSRWCTHTNNEKIAEKWTIENKERLLTEYAERKTSNRKPYADLYAILKNYYAENSLYLKTDRENGRMINEDARISYHNFITRQFIPYLRKAKIKTIEQIDTPLLAQFRKQMRYGITKKNGTVEKVGIKPQTINHYISYINMIFDHLITEGYIKTNPCKSLKSLKIQKGDEKITGCYEINKLKGVFNRRWNDELSYMLNLVIYTTDMRNIEIEKLCLRDIVTINNIHFIDIKESKSKNGIRLVPLHDFVYRKISNYAKRLNKNIDEPIFRFPKCKKLSSRIYKRAYYALAKQLKYTEERLRAENIRFYSGRHFWKTLMNANGLGDAEEVFMGHKVSADVAKRYNHRDKQGQTMMLKKAKEVFTILDKALFKT
jgi:integrase